MQSAAECRSSPIPRQNRSVRYRPQFGLCGLSNKPQGSNWKFRVRLWSVFREVRIGIRRTGQQQVPEGSGSLLFSHKRPPLWPLSHICPVLRPLQTPNPTPRHFRKRAVTECNAFPFVAPRVLCDSGQGAYASHTHHLHAHSCRAAGGLDILRPHPRIICILPVENKTRPDHVCLQVWTSGYIQPTNANSCAASVSRPILRAIRK